MALREDILALATRVSGGPPKGDPEADFLAAFGLTGADATRFFDFFADRYEDSLDGFLWYVHFAGTAPVVPIAPDGRPIPRRPVTLATLVEAADSARWPLTYPPHSLRRSLPARLKIAGVIAGLLFLALAATLARFL